MEENGRQVTKPVLPARFHEGAELFNGGCFFEAHEVWEEEWREAPAAERDFYQGMIHLTVSLYQAGRANWKAAHSQLRRGARRLARYEPVYRGVAVRELRDGTADAVLRIQAGGRGVRLPRIELAA
jgi:uncharacterized protein